MKYITEKLTTPVIDECDVLVAGGGIAGIAAALAAARQGKKVILCENQFMLGGLGTAGLITMYLPICDGCGHQVSFGIAEELLHLSISEGCEASYPKPWLENGEFVQKEKIRFMTQYNPQMFAVLAEKLLLKENVKIMYGTRISGVNVEKEKINCIIAENKSGRIAYNVKSVVDCTGDADICKMSGEDTELFGQGNILAAWYYYSKKEEYGLKIIGASDVPDDEKSDKNKTELLISKRFSGLDGEELSEMVQLSHDVLFKDIIEKRKTDSSYFPVTIATVPQIRMTRRIRGMYAMTINDDRRDFEDSVGMFSNWKKRGPVYELPFSCLHGEKVKNLITAGRCIAAQDSMWDVSRVISVCAVSGEAAGVAAALSDDFCSLDIKELQSVLVSNGVRLYFDDVKGLKN